MRGRELPPLKRVFPGLGVSDKLVAENEALIYTSFNEQERMIATPPDAKFVAKLKERGCGAAFGGSVNRCDLGAASDHRTQSHQEIGIGLEIIFNKGAVMILPSGQQSTGMAAAGLQDLSLSPHNVFRRWRC